MNPQEQALATLFYEAVQLASTQSERSQQSADFRIGMSDLGWCSELTRRMLAGIPEPTTSDKLPAFLGTAIGDHVEAAFAAQHPDALRHQRVSITFTGEHGTYVVSGHPDLILVDDGVLVDVKTKRGLAIVERSGPDQQQQFQRHGYAKGAWEAGFFGDRPLAEVQVANVWFDRAGDERRCHVQMEPYDPEIVRQAGLWVDDVVYAYLHGEEALKEPPRDMCAKVCGHFADCRGMETDVEGLITDPEALTAIEVYREGVHRETEGRRMKDQAKIALAGRSGSTGTWNLRWTLVNETPVSYLRAAYLRLDLKPVK
jgi:hypothetical protein